MAMASRKIGRISTRGCYATRNRRASTETVRLVSRHTRNDGIIKRHDMRSSDAQ